MACHKTLIPKLQDLKKHAKARKHLLAMDKLQVQTRTDTAFHQGQFPDLLKQEFELKVLQMILLNHFMTTFLDVSDIRSASTVPRCERALLVLGITFVL